MELQHSLRDKGMSGLRVIHVEQIVQQHVVGGGLRLECVEDVAGFLIEAFHDDIVEEEWLDDVKSILNEGFAILLVQEGVENAQVRDVTLLSILRVSQAGKSLI